MTLRRVAYVLKTFPKLSETFISEELAEVVRRGLDVRIYAMKRPDECLVHEIATRARLLERVTYDLDAFRRELRSFRPQLIHAHFATEPTRLARELAVPSDCPFTFTAHGHDVYRKAPPDFADRAAAAAAVVTVSEANARYITERFGVPREQLHVVSCGVDVQCFRPARSRPEPGLIVCVARMSPVKNLGLLIRACGRLRDRGIPFRCVLIGEGRCRPELETLQAELRLEDRLEFAGALTQDQVISWWQRASVGALTSHSEGMPVSLMEAAACGVPVVATAVGGIPELVDNGRTGIVVPADQAQDLAEALGQLLANEPRRREMGRAARERAVARFSVSHQLDQLTAIWEEACVPRTSMPVIA